MGIDSGAMIMSIDQTIERSNWSVETTGPSDFDVA